MNSVRLYSSRYHHILKNVRFISTSHTYSDHRKNNYHQRDFNQKKSAAYGATLSLGLFFGKGFFTSSLLAETEKEEDPSSSSEHDVGDRIEGLPEFTKLEVGEHHCQEKRIWVIYKNGVFDITDFIPEHPGAEKIMMAAGGSVEPFWNVFGFHKKPEVKNLLWPYRIGNLKESDVEENKSISADDPWINEPARHPALRPVNLKPFNAESPMLLLPDNFITPSELFYVRNHLPVPKIEESSYTLEVEIEGVDQELSFTLEDLKTKFPKHTIMATLQCGGNRRADMNKEKTVAGLAWEGGAISNATWTGVLVSDVLKALGVDGNDPRFKHVQFEGTDLGPDGAPYGASIPIEKALNPYGDVLLAYEMNGEPLARDHGYPVRVVVPGTVASRSVKWVQRIVVSDSESPSHWQQKDYKVLNPNVTQNPEFSEVPAIQALPVTSAVCEPSNGSTVTLPTSGNLLIKGYAYSGGGNTIRRVDISADGGNSWYEAKLERGPKMAPRNWSWVLWRVEVPISERGKEIEIWSRAVDSSNNIQPEDYKATWNLRGLLANAVCKIKCKIQ